jgi:hypothetical protein
MDMDQLKAFAQALHSSPELQAKLHNAYAMAARSVAAEAGFSINELTDTELAAASGGGASQYSGFVQSSGDSNLSVTLPGFGTFNIPHES